MIENLSAALALIATWYNLAAIAAGMIFGVVIGAIPGLTGNMAVALALPFTFYMHPITGLLLLVGLYKGAIYGGSISAILIKTPGTPAASCTVLDGYPLTEKGQARKALDMALYASCAADFVSNLALIFCTGWIAAFAMRFGPPEFFTLICFSMTMIAGVSGGSAIKGFISAGLGLLAATVGLDLMFSTERLTFGNADLMAGINFIPVLIGLFALPEMLQGVGGGDAGQIAKVDAGRLTWPEFRASLKTILRGSLIGVVMGAIPAVGPAPAAFLSYSEARRTSKNGDEFGKGELEGVAAAESGNSGCCGSTMIPLLSLGVPGDPITAIMLGAFMIHGLTPGPLIFKQNAPLVYALFIGILFSSFMMYLAGRGVVRVFSKVVNIPKRLLFPSVMVLCVFGVYAVNNSMLDVLVMIVAGGVGYLMLLTHTPPAPFIIAFILGPMFEDNLRRSLIISNGGYEVFFASPISWVFIILTVASIFFTALRAFRKSRSARCAA
ncbi:MAG: tripartite tricarboxylate transporter permease [Desulfovibrio aminophilus]|uniref:tripartite tricarboxylate transporter permease n=1 Tax=Desulfovibrio aminophilus TaxID=81425 RepID=UPI0039EA8306